MDIRNTLIRNYLREFGQRVVGMPGLDLLKNKTKQNGKQGFVPE